MQTDENEIGESEKKEIEIQDLVKNEVEIHVTDKESLEKEIQCKDCKLPIEPESKKCHHCGSWQGKYSRIFKGMINFITIAMLGIAVSQAVIGYSQYKESKNKRIEAEGVLKQAEQVLEEAITESEKIRKKAELTLSQASNALTIANSVSLETKDEANKVLTIAKDEANKVLSMARNESKTAIEKAKEARKGFDKASNDVKADLEESNERISFAEANFLKKFSKLKSDLEELKHDSTVELAILKDRNELVAIADKAVVHGDRDSLEKLDKIIQDEDELQDKLMAAASEKLRVYSYYLSGTRISRKKELKFTENNNVFINDEIPTNILINTLTCQVWMDRGRAAQILADRKEKEVPEALINSIKTDPSLDVLECSIRSFCQLTGCISYDIFKSEPIINWWEENKERVESELSIKE